MIKQSSIDIKSVRHFQRTSAKEFDKPMHAKKTPARHSTGVLFLAVLLSVTGWTAAAEPSAKEKELTEQQKMNLQTVVSAAAFRSGAMQDQTGSFKKFLTGGAFAAWKKQISQLNPKTGPMGVADFINTSVLLLGPQTQDGGVCALYSPFQDVILLMQTDNLESFSKVENFRFLPGAVFRGEKLDAKVPPETLLPDLPLTIALMKVFAKTEEAFKKIATASDPLARYSTVTADQLHYIEAVMDTRNRIALTLLKEENRDALLLATVVRTALRKETAAELKEHLQPGVYQEQGALFAELPKEIRGGMELCHRLTSPERDLFAFMNPLFPRFIAIVTLDVKKPESKWTLEWFDLNNSKALYPIYEKESKSRK